VKIFFLSNQNSCRSQMAEAILRSFDKSLEIYSAGINPADHISQVAIEVLDEIGVKLEPTVPEHFSKFENIAFDYLITVGDGTVESLNIPVTIKYKRLIHLGFHNPYKHFVDRNDLKDQCAEIRDEIYIELDYFYRKMVNKKEE